MSFGPNHVNTKQVVETLREHVRRIGTPYNDSGTLRLTAAYLHGSLAAGEASDVSDVDIVVAVDSEVGDPVSSTEITKRLQFAAEDVVYAAGLPIRAEPENADLIARESPEEALDAAKSFARDGGYDVVYDLLDEERIKVD